jgi:transposase
MPISWELTASQLGYGSELELWTDLYVTRGFSISELATKLDVSRNTIRTALERVKIDVRKQGGPNNQKFDVTDEIIEEIRLNGIAAVAKRLDLSYTTVYKRVKIRATDVADTARAQVLTRALGDLNELDEEADDAEDV